MNAFCSSTGLVVSRLCRLVSAGLLGLCLSSAVSADDDEFCSAAQPGCIAIGELNVSLGLGLGLRSNPLLNGDDLPLFILPEIRYYGERFFFDTYTGGFTFFDNGAHLINAVATIGFDQIYFKTFSIGNLVIDAGPLRASTESAFQSDDYELVPDDMGLDPIPPEQLEVELENLHSRDTAGLAGLEYGYYNHHWDASIQLLQDVTAVHKGQEIRAAASRFVNIGGQSFQLAGGFSWQSADLLQYYYGVEAEEVDTPELAYSPKAGLSPFVRIDWRKPISKKWYWQATLHHRWLSKEITGSPLLDEDAVLTVYVGGVYHF